MTVVQRRSSVRAQKDSQPETNQIVSPPNKQMMSNIPESGRSLPTLAIPGVIAAKIIQ